MKNQTPKPPVVRAELWNDLYEQAIRYQSLTPQKKISRDEVFAFADPLSKKIGYCCIPAASEGFSGLSVYRGREGLEMYLELKRKELDPKGIDVLHKHNALVMEFTENRKTLEKEDLRVLKSIGLPKKSPVPGFRSYLPGFKGWFFTEEEVLFFTLALRCSARHLTEGKLAVFSSKTSPSDCLLYIPEGQGKSIRWRALEHTVEPIEKKPPAPVTLDSRMPESLKEIKLCRDGAWEASIINTSNVLCNNERPYLVKICMIVHKETLSILHVKQVPLHGDPGQTVCDELLAAVKKHRRIPSEVLFSDPLLHQGLQPLMKALGIQGTSVDVLQATVPARDSLLEYMQ